MQILSVANSQSRVFCQGIDFESIEPSLQISLACKTPSNDSKMLLKVVFDQTAFKKFRISDNFKQNIYETHSKQQKIHTRQWILKVLSKQSTNQKSQDFCQMFVISKKKTIPQAMYLKIYRKSIAQPMDYMCYFFF